MGGPCSTNGEKRNAYRLLVGKPEIKKPLGNAGKLSSGLTSSSFSSSVQLHIVS
jgi:hypothetical protein